MFAAAHFNAPLLCHALLGLLCAAGSCALPHSMAGHPVNEERSLMMNHSPKDEGLQPNPDLSPEQVVTIQLEALQHNDTPERDSGIAIAFRFASPANQAATGPLANFILLVKNPLYQPLLNHRSVERAPVKIAGDEAQQRVILMSATGVKAVYLFTLSKQADGRYKDCWMTDGVERINSDGPLKGEQVASGNGHLKNLRLL